MKTLIRFAAVVALAVIVMSCATAMREQSGAQTDWNEQYRYYFEVPVSKIYTGRSPYMRSTLQSPVLAAAPSPKVALPSETAPKPLPVSVSPIKTSSEDRTWGLIRLGESMPAEATLGGEFVVDLSLTAQGSAANVVLRDIIPVNASYVRSEPAAKVEGVQLVWELGNLDAGQTLSARIWFKAEQEGAVVNCATVTANPRVCGTTVVGRPVIAMDKSGPETAVLGTDVTFDIVVKNTGTGTVRNVVVTDPVPAGMSHASGKSELSLDVGDLAPGQAKSLAVTFKANQRGQVCNTATAQSSNAGKVSKNACTLILAPGLKVEKSGTKEQILGRNADYEIVVTNPGDTTLRNVVVSDRTATETSIVAAPGATLTGNKATWKIDELKPGAKHSVSIKLTSKVAGTHCNTVTVSSGGLSDSAQACTLWKGMAAVLLEVADDPDPIQVGESTTYTIRVVNQGSADVHNLKIMARFADQIVPFSTAQGSISGKIVSFPAMAALGAKQTLTYTISVKGGSTGDSRNKVTLTCEELKTPVEEEESTTVY
jgi:uncharacterized repeat protein (TIGR01451 family)